MAIHCPHCGSPVIIRDSRLACGWCGDFGALLSLHPSERTKLDDTIHVTVTVTVTESEEASKEFTQAELEAMVHRWDFTDNEDAIRDLLLAVEMWRKVLDVALGHLQEAEQAEYLLGDPIGDSGTAPLPCGLF